MPSFTATPSFGPAPLHVAFEQRLHGCDRDPLTYAWDLDGDGQYDDATGLTTSRTYSGSGDVEVGLQVSDGTSTRTTSRTVSVANDPPSVTITTPDGRRSALERRRH